MFQKSPRGYVTNQSQSVDNSVMVNGDNHAPIVTGSGNVVSYSQTSQVFDWDGLQSDINLLNNFIADFLDDGEKKQNVQATVDELQMASDQRNESAVMTALKKAGKTTLDLILSITREVLPALIMQKLKK